ncbi:MAG: hypothetical protein Q7J28_02780 [Caulobacter sp.]|nr:hypothetical protein [Caulobacter sp.]
MHRIALTLVAALSALVLSACEKAFEAPTERGICYHMAYLPDGGYKFNVVARDIDSIEKCAAQLEGMRLRFLRLGGQNAEMIGAYQGSFIHLRRGGIFRAQKWNGNQYLMLVRTGDGRLVMPGAVQ